jgi:hypothetical protein
MPDCPYCSEPIQPGDPTRELRYGSRIMPVHAECLFRQAAGSLGHLRKRCSCYGGNEGDPPGMTTRQAARAAFVYWQTLEARN